MFIESLTRSRPDIREPASKGGFVRILLVRAGRSESLVQHFSITCLSYRKDFDPAAKNLIKSTFQPKCSPRVHDEKSTKSDN